MSGITATLMIADCKVTRLGNRAGYTWQVHSIGRSYLLAAIRACRPQYRLPWQQLMLDESNKRSRPMQDMIDEFDQRLVAVRIQMAQQVAA